MCALAAVEAKSSKNHVLIDDIPIAAVAFFFPAFVCSCILSIVKLPVALLYGSLFWSPDWNCPSPQSLALLPALVYLENVVSFLQCTERAPQLPQALIARRPSRHPGTVFFCKDHRTELLNLVLTGPKPYKRTICDYYHGGLSHLYSMPLIENSSVAMKNLNGCWSKHSKIFNLF